MSDLLLPKAYSLNAHEGRALWHLNALLNFKALCAETNGQFWALEGLADGRLAVPRHTHSCEDEVWYVLEGEIVFTLGAETRTTGPGSFVYIPRRTPHTFQIKSETARWFGFGLAGELDQWFFEMGEPAATLSLPPIRHTPDIKTIAASWKAYGTDTLGPLPNASP